MTGVALPMRLAIAPVIDVAADWRPTLTVKKGPVSSNMSIMQASSFTDSMINFQGFIPPNDMTCIRRNLTIHYKPLVKVSGIPGWLYNVLTGSIPAQGRGGVDICIPLPANLVDAKGVSFLSPGLNQWPGAISGTALAFSPGLWIPGLALRSLPLQSICSNIVLNINGTSITYPAQDVAPLLPYLNWIDLSRTHLSTVPFYPSEGPFFLEPAGTGLNIGWDNLFPWPTNIFSGGTNTMVICAATSNTYGSQVNPFGEHMLYFSQVQQMYTSGGRSIPWKIRGVVAKSVTFDGVSTAKALAYDVVLEADVYEDIAVGPFKLGDAFEETGMMRVNNLSLQLNFSNPSNMLALACSLTQAWPCALEDAGAQCPPCHWASGWDVQCSLVSVTMGGTTYNASDTPTLNLELNTADPVTMARFPNFIIQPTEIYQSYITTNMLTVPQNQSVAEFATSGLQRYTQTLPAIRSTFIPNKLIIYLSRDKSVPISNSLPTPAFTPSVVGYHYVQGVTAFNPNIVAAKVSNHYLRIHSVSINAFDRVALMSTLTEKDLHERSARNGYKGSFRQWTREWGSILIIDMAEDLCLGTQMAAGQNTNANIQVTLTYSDSCAVTNAFNPETVTPYYGTTAPTSLPGYMALSYSATQILVFNGSCVIGAGQMTVTQEGPTEAQVLRLLQQEESRIQSKDIPKQLTGGSLMDQRLMSSENGTIAPETFTNKRQRTSGSGSGSGQP